MATMSAARIRSLCRRHNHAHEAVYHFSANPVQHVVTGFFPTRAIETSPAPSVDERFRAALRREMAKVERPGAGRRCGCPSGGFDVLTCP